MSGLFHLANRTCFRSLQGAYNPVTSWETAYWILPGPVKSEN